MTLSRPVKLPRRVNTDADLAAATKVAEQMHHELEELLERRKMLEEKYPALIDPGEDTVSNDLKNTHSNINFRIGGLQRDLLAWSNTVALTVIKQIEARHKSGELVSVSSVATYLNATAILIRKYTDAKFRTQAEQEARRLFQNFVQANPAALLEAGAEAREQQNELEE